MNMTLGLDVHKRTTAYALVNERGEVQQRGETKTNPKLCLELVSWLPSSAVQIGMESSTYIYPLYDAFNDAGYRVRVAHPAKLSRITKAEVKHDDKDALDLALQLLRNDFPESYILSKEMRDKRQMIRQHMTLTNEESRIKCRIHSLLAQYDIRVPCQLGTKKSFEFMQAIQLPTNSKLTLEIFTLQLKKAKELLRLIDTQIRHFVANNKEAQAIMRLDGVGEFTAATFLIELGDWKRFKSVKQLTSYAAMIPKMSGSAHKMYYGRMRTDGNQQIRFAFNRAAEQAIRKDNQFKLCFQKLISKGKRRRTAIGAIANKLLRCCYGVLHAEELNNSGSSMERG